MRIIVSFCRKNSLWPARLLFFQRVQRNETSNRTHNTFFAPLHDSPRCRRLVVLALQVEKSVNVIADKFVRPRSMKLFGLLPRDGRADVNFRHLKDALGVFRQVKGKNVGGAFVVQKLSVQRGHAPSGDQVETAFPRKGGKLRPNKVFNDFAKKRKIHSAVSLRIAKSNFQTEERIGVSMFWVRKTACLISQFSIDILP